ncbi:DUF7544 domain-containing protein [Halarchaeum sp. P4]|uniref:DUF7544 domain-containing protein n=1 Tax=Halarchaeum sp. P4 TaxID=3421639 RepID=UPI003EBD71EE
MSLHAVDDVTDALSVTGAFLHELRPRDWLKLAVVALLTGGASSGFSGSSNLDTGGTGGSTDVGIPNASLGDLLTMVPLWVWAFVAVALLLGFALAVLGSILEFTFVEALRTGDVELRRTVAENWGKGLRLFGFNLVVTVLVLGSFALAVLPLLVGLRLGAAFLLLLPVAVVLALVAAIVSGFTRAFVVPIMLQADVGVLAGWRRLWSVLRAHPKEYGAFVVANLVLTLIGGVAVAIASVVVAIAVFIPVGLAFGLPFVLMGASGIVAWVWLAVGVVVGLLAFLLGVGLVSAPVQAYLRYYALLLLGDTEPDFDLLPERRAAAREEGGDGDAAAA